MYRGGLFYPTSEVIRLLRALQRFVEIMVSDHRSLEKPLEACLQHSVSMIADLPILKYRNCGDGHRWAFVELTCKKLIKPLLSDHAFIITDKSAVTKIYGKKKIISRKFEALAFHCDCIVFFCFVFCFVYIAECLP